MIQWHNWIENGISNIFHNVRDSQSPVNRSNQDTIGIVLLLICCFCYFNISKWNDFIFSYLLVISIVGTYINTSIINYQHEVSLFFVSNIFFFLILNVNGIKGHRAKFNLSYKHLINNNNKQIHSNSDWEQGFGNIFHLIFVSKQMDN